MSVFAITGAGGYIGQRLIEHLDKTGYCSRILATDIKKPSISSGKMVFSQNDIRDKKLFEFFSGNEIDCLIHLAFIVDPIHDYGEMYDVNVNGAMNILNICEKLKIKHVIVTSSAMAYGAYPDNKEFLNEEDPIRIFPKSFPYPHHKAIIEGYCKDFMARKPGVIFNIIRPHVVYGPNVDNVISRFWTKFPVVMLLNGNDIPWQFVHEEDVAAFIIRLMERKVPGTFNIVPGDTVRFSEIAAMIGKPAVKVPLWLGRLLGGLLWKLKYLEIPPASLDYTAFPWTLDGSKGERELGFRYSYSSRETIEIMLKTHGLWSGGK